MPTHSHLRNYEKSIDSGYNTSLSDDDSPFPLPSPPPSPSPDEEMDYSPLDESSIISSPTLSDDQKSRLLCDLFIRIASSPMSNENMERLEKLLNVGFYSQHIDIDETDEEGNTALIYASALGCCDVVRLLVEKGARIDCRDLNDWTPLFWSSVNGHSKIVKYLIEKGADRQVVSKSGKSIRDVIGKKITPQNRSIVRILDDRDYDYEDETSSLASWSIYDEDTQSSISFPLPDSSSTCSSPEKSDFEWTCTICPPDQMLVYDTDNPEGILSVAIIKVWVAFEASIRGKHKTKTTERRGKAKGVWQSASILFLCIRFGEYWCGGGETVSEFCQKAVRRIVGVIRDTLLLSYWQTNLLLLLSFLKRDSRLQLTTHQTQQTISELIEEVHMLLVREFEARLLAVIEPGVLHFDGSDDDDDVPVPRHKTPRYQNSLVRKLQRVKWGDTFKLPDVSLGIGAAMGMHISIAPSTSPPRSSPPLPQHPGRQRAPSLGIKPKPLPSNLHPTPRTLTTLLSTILQTLLLTQTHPQTLHLIFHTLLHFVSTHVFNTLLTSPEQLTKHTALKTRVNLSTLQDWIRDIGRIHIPSGEKPLESHLKPVINLCRFLGVVTSLRGVESFLEVGGDKGWGLGFLQMERIISNYRYEVGEETVCEEIAGYVEQMAESLRNHPIEPSSPSDDSSWSMDPRENPTVDLLDVDYSAGFQVPVVGCDDGDDGTEWGMGAPWVDEEVLGGVLGGGGDGVKYDFEVEEGATELVKQ